MPSLDFEAEKTAFRAYYNENYQRLRSAEDFIRSLATTLIATADEIEKPVVSSRVKDREECIAKFSRKYQRTLEELQQPYEIAPHITDLIGIRIVCLYESEIEDIVRILRQNFEVIEESNKISKIESTEGTFGYKGFHLDLRVNQARLDFPEYSQFREFRFEVQARTTIQDAWSALDHKIKYKKSIPPSLKRRINTLAALFELADHEFLSIRRKSEELLSRAKDETTVNFGTATVKTLPASAPLSPIDVFTFLSAVEPHFEGYSFLSHAADSFVQELLGLKSDFSGPELSKVLDNHLATVKAYKAESPHRLNPYTQIRHSLYLYEPNTFKLALFDMQRKQFDQWLSHQ